jgi:preprotein translocase subunit YajC
MTLPAPILAQNTQPSPAPAQPSAPVMQAPPAGQEGFKLPGGGAGQTQTPGSPSGATGGSSGQSGVGGLGMFLPLALVLLLVLVMTSMSGRKERKRRDALLSSVKKGDRVQTTAGVIGTIVDLTDSEMTLRVDEASNTRIRFTRGAVQQVVREGGPGGSPQPELKPRTPAATAM